MDGFAALLKGPKRRQPHMDFGRPTSAIFCKIEAEHWPTSIYRPFSSICEPAAVHGRRGEGATTTPRSAPSVIATTWCKSVFVDAA
jgi:hypothetical protein